MIVCFAVLMLMCFAMAAVPAGRFALVVHGGAGRISTDLSPDQRQAYEAGLASALQAGRAILQVGGTALDAVEAAVRALEDNPLFNAGRGAVYTADGAHELDAAVMDGRTLACGAVTGVTTIQSPIALARLVMEHSGHVLLAGDGAEAFATRHNVPRVENAYFDTPHRSAELQHRLAEEKAEPTKRFKHRGTVGAVALDTHGHLAAATSTGGMTAKRFGRVGDSPIVGAGTYADDRTVAVSCTGHGEEFIRHSVAYDISARVAYKGQTVADAVHAVVHETLKPDDGGLIAVGPRGEIVMAFNTHGMYRGCCDSTGRFEVAMFGEKNEPPITPINTDKKYE